MFEFFDDRLGRIKVVNVTEARASMASIMNDKEFTYIITKNNRPVRVVINYDAILKGQLLNPPALKPTEYKNPVFGKLSNQEQDFKNQLQRQLHSAEIEIPTPPPAIEASIEVEIPQQEPEIFEETESAPVSESNVASTEDFENFSLGGDYFTEDSQEDSLPPPEPLESPILEDEVESLEEKLSLDIADLEISEETVLPVLEEPPSIEIESLPEPVIASKPPEVAAPKPANPLSGFSSLAPPPNSDYFIRFKKLYEAPRYETLFQKSPEKTVMETSAPARSPFVPNTSVLPEVPTVVPAPLSGTPKVPSTGLQNTIQSTIVPQMVSQSTASLPAASLPAAGLPTAGPSRYQGLISSQKKSISDPPSIQDLLMDLEGEQLSWDEESKDISKA